MSKTIKFTIVPNDLIDKYIELFDQKQLKAVFVLIRQAHEIGLKNGRNEVYDELEK
ncbi:MAG: hypothetical protein KAS07_04755 [Candidatus Pacebacteria bacterium]|nr:hypothetical protein [Candidatus Paceibacterota bacterium]